jgi:hypothetical protein
LLILRLPRRIAISASFSLPGRLGWLCRLLVIAVLLLALLLIAAGDGLSPHGTRLTGDLPIGAPRVASTGDQINVEIGPVSVSNGTPVGLVMVGAHGPRVYNATFEAGMAHFVIPSGDTLQPGYLALIVAADDARGETSILLYSHNKGFGYLAVSTAPASSTM